MKMYEVFLRAPDPDIKNWMSDNEIEGWNVEAWYDTARLNDLTVRDYRDYILKEARFYEFEKFEDAVLARLKFY